MLLQPPPLVSIVIATYNGATFLRQQLDTVIAQTYSRIEIIVIDDRSSDSTLSILNEYAGRNSNLKIYQNEVNLGHIKTFERGISFCTGEYIFPCDQDDVWDNNKLLLMMKALEKDSPVIYCDSAFIDDQGNSLHRKISDIKNLKTYESVLPFIIGNCVSGHAAMFTRKIALQAMPFPPTIIHDWWLAFVASTQGKIQFLDLPLVQYRQHTGNVIGAIKIKGRKKKKPAIDALTLIRTRVAAFNEACPESHDAKPVLRNIMKSYSSFSLANNFLRMTTFFKYKEQLLATKKRTPIRRWLFCVKIFFAIR